MQGLALTAAIDGDLAAAREIMRNTLDHGLRSLNRAALVVTTEGVAFTANLAGEHDRAARLAGAIDRLAEVLGVVVPHPLRVITHVRETAREALGDETFRIRVEEGRAMTFERAVGYARESLEALTSGR